MLKPYRPVACDKGVLMLTQMYVLMAALKYPCCIFSESMAWKRVDSGRPG